MQEREEQGPVQLQLRTVQPEGRLLRLPGLSLEEPGAPGLSVPGRRGENVGPVPAPVHRDLQGRSLMAGHRFVYGPVASRRLGFSRGVDIIPFKTCTLDCMYCQLGSTRKTVCRRGSWFPQEEILAQVKEAVESGQKIDAITFSGSGRPTPTRAT